VRRGRWGWTGKEFVGRGLARAHGRHMGHEKDRRTVKKMRNLRRANDDGENLGPQSENHPLYKVKDVKNCFEH